jgi:hypothetical protein
MKTILWTLTLPVIAISLGCFSLGTWAGHDERIVAWEPRLTEEAPAPPPAPVQSSVAAPWAVRPPDVLVATAKTPATNTPPVEMPTEKPAPIDPGVLIAAKVEKPAAAEPEKPAAETTPPAASPESMIDDAAKLDSNSTRRSVYVAVAKRPDLGPNAQIRLINDTYDNLVSETAIEEVFITLIQNPNFSPAAQHAILKRADEFLGDSARQRITAALTPKK